MSKSCEETKTAAAGAGAGVGAGALTATAASDESKGGDGRTSSGNAAVDKILASFTPGAKFTPSLLSTAVKVFKKAYEEADAAEKADPNPEEGIPVPPLKVADAGAPALSDKVYKAYKGVRFAVLKGGKLLIIQCVGPQHEAAVQSLSADLTEYARANPAGHGAHMTVGGGSTVFNGNNYEPDVVVRSRAPGFPPVFVIEVEYQHRSTPQLMAQVQQYFAEPNVQGVLGMIAYNAATGLACAAVVYLRVGGAIVVAAAWDLGPRALNQGAVNRWQTPLAAVGASPALPGVAAFTVARPVPVAPLNTVADMNYPAPGPPTYNVPPGVVIVGAPVPVAGPVLRLGQAVFELLRML